LSFAATQNDTVGIVVDALASTASPYAYTLAINAPEGINPAYFAMAKAAGHIVTVSGTNGDAVSAIDAGETVEGSEAGPELAVFAVDTSSVLEEGGDLLFTLTVAEEGKTPVEIAVALTVETPFISLLWIDSGEGETEILTEVADQGDITDLEKALTWLETNAVDNTKYVVKVSAAENWLTTHFSSRKDRSNVHITLRGIGGERKVYANQLPPSGNNNYRGMFTIESGTTLTLDANITLDGRDQALCNSESGTGTIQNMVTVLNTGVVEMKAGSKITRHLGTNNYTVMVESGGTFKMYGGTIDHCVTKTAIVELNAYTLGSPTFFGMWEGAKITDNTISSTNNNAFPGQSAVLLKGDATFIMHGGEISNTTDKRAVLVSGTGTNKQANFIMKGGVIKNNGKSMPRAGGVLLASQFSNFYMEGGEISGNGNSTMPGSGIYIPNQYGGIATLNGSVKITDNTIGLSADASVNSSLSIGSNFASSSAIAVDLCMINADGEEATFGVNWHNKQVLNALDEDDSTITINNAITGKFTPVRCYKDDLSEPVYYSDLTYGINDSGAVVNLAAATE
jgi:hypothetical protein